MVVFQDLLISDLPPNGMHTEENEKLERFSFHTVKVKVKPDPPAVNLA